MTNDEPLTEPLCYTGHLIRRAQQRHVALWTQTVSAQISSVQYSVLIALDREAPLNQSELGQAVSLDRSTVADLVARMERHDLIVRRPDPHDGRSTLLELTEHGRAERRRLKPAVRQVEEELTRLLSGRTRQRLKSDLRELLGIDPAD